MTRVYVYDTAGRITGITQGPWASRAAAGEQAYTTPVSWAPGYDSRNRLTSLARDGASRRYTYDANSNRLAAVDSATSDIDLDGVLDAGDFTQSTSQTLNVEAASNRLLGLAQTVEPYPGCGCAPRRPGLEGADLRVPHGCVGVWRQMNTYNVMLVARDGSATVVHEPPVVIRVPGTASDTGYPVSCRPRQAASIFAGWARPSIAEVGSSPESARLPGSSCFLASFLRVRALM
ncbi:hypothetical protein ACFPOE_17060 [Caenimonas terrae]|uniref:RHS repeat protein n=1 Tax=Caenimonas terrae TaxID=696074 RepID=A0ABW0NI62_9BURK